MKVQSRAERRKEIQLEICLWDTIDKFLPLKPQSLIFVLSKMISYIAAKHFK